MSMQEAIETVKLAKKIRSILLATGVPVSISQLVNATNQEMNRIRRACELLASEKQAQRGNKGWRAI